MAKIPGLIRRGKTYYLRVRVPKDVLPQFKSKEIVRSLKTRDYDKAAKHIHSVRADIEAEFDAARKKLKAKAGNADVLSGYRQAKVRGQRNDYPSVRFYTPSTCLKHASL